MLMMLITMGFISYVIFEGASTMTKDEEFSKYEAYLDSKVAEYAVYLKIAMLILGAAVVLYLIYKGTKK